MQSLLAAQAAALTMAGSSWRLGLNIGREPGTAMPVDWGSSGARLALKLDVSFLSAACDAAIRPVDEPLLGRPIIRLDVDGPTSFVGVRGEETVATGPGGWAETALPAAPGRSALRFFVDIPEGAARNDVDCPAGRVFFTTNYWTEAALADCEAAATQAQAALDEVEAELQAAITARSEGNPFQRAMAVRRSVLLTESQQLLQSQIRDAKRALPDSGTVEGPAGLRVSRRGGLSVKRPRKLGFGGDFYYILGTFSMAPREGEVR